MRAPLYVVMLHPESRGDRSDAEVIEMTHDVGALPLPPGDSNRARVTTSETIPKGQVWVYQLARTADVEEESVIEDMKDVIAWNGSGS